MHISIRLYKITAIQVIADLTSQRGSAVWNNINKDIGTGKPMNMISERLDNRNAEVSLYWRLFDSQKEMKKDKLKGWVLDNLDKNSMLNNSEETEKTETTETTEKAKKTGRTKKIIDIEIKDYVILKELQIGISYNYNTAMGDILSKVGIERYGYGKGAVTSKSAVIEPAEFIRSVDLLLEVGGELRNYYVGIKESFSDIEDSDMEDIAREK